MTKKHHFRSSPRPLVACQVVLQPLTGQIGPIETCTRDIGTGGLFAETGADLSPGERVEVTLATPATWDPIVLAAEVCRLEGAGSGSRKGVGLRFLEMEDEQAVALAEFVATLDFEA